MSGFDEVVDFVVAGSGGGSMCAAVFLGAQGKSVLILEKTELVGGTTARSGGVMWLPNNSLMARDSVPDSQEQATTYLEAVSGGRNDTPGSTRERRETYVVEASRMLDFLMDRGLKFERIRHWPDYYDERPGAKLSGRCVVAELFDANELGPWKDKLRPSFLNMPAKLEEAMQVPNIKKTLGAKLALGKIILRTLAAKLTGKHYVSAGAALQGRMLKAALDAGADIRTDSPVRELVVENGAVTGVVTVKDGQPWRVGARLGVLVNAGGFAHNQRMRDQHAPGTSVAWTSASPGDTGEMIEEMMRHGAAIGQMEEVVGFRTTLPPGAEQAPVKPPAQSLTTAPHAILVDQTGVRYMNECGSDMECVQRMIERNKVAPAVPSWAVFDSQYIANYMLAGTMPGANKPQTWLDAGYLKKADTIEALAQQMQVEPSALKGAVERFNGFVANNRDDDFKRGDRAYDRWLGDATHKPSETLGKIETAPFYAVQVYPGDVSTYGGVVTDEHARVLREDGSVIQGLYATGVSTASVMGRFEPGAGCSVGPSLVWGYVAAKHAGSAAT